MERAPLNWKLMTVARMARHCWVAAVFVARSAWAEPDPSAPAPASTGDAASPTQRDAAAAAFQHGEELRRQGAIAEALVEYERAYQLSPVYQVLYHIGALNVALRQWARARRAFELYLELGEGELAPKQMQEVQAHLEELNKKTATLTLTLNVDVAGAQVTVDGAQVESTKIAGLVVDPGEHVVQVSKPGFQPLQQTLKAGDGENLHLVLPLAPVALDTATPLAATQPPPDGVPAPIARAQAEVEPSRVPLWVPWTITGALAAGWGTTAGLAIKARHDRDIIEQPGTSPDRIDAARQLHITLAVVSDVLLAATLASAGVSAYLTWWSEPPPNTLPGTPQGQWRSPEGVALCVSGHF